MARGMMIIHNLGQPVAARKGAAPADDEEEEGTPEEEAKETPEEEAKEEEDKLHAAVDNTNDEEIKKLKDDVYNAIEEHDDPRDCLKAITTLLIEGLAGGIEE